MVVFDVAGRRYPLDEKPATILAETLRVKAAQFDSGEGVERARDVADLIEAVLVGNIEVAIILPDDAAEAVYYVLDKDPAAAEEGEVRDLYLAVRALHHERLARGG